MKKLFALLSTLSLGAFLLTPPLAAAQGNSGEHGHGHDHGDGGDHGNGRGHGNDQGDRQDHDQGHGNSYGNAHGNYGHHFFRNEDTHYLTQYYTGPRDLPPGLRKKYYRTGMLPPGWQNQFSPLPVAVLQQMPPVPYGYQTGYYNGYAIVVNPRTRVIYDAIDMIGALTGH